MSQKFVVVETTTGKQSLIASLGASLFSDEFFDVAVAGTTFSLVADILVGTKIDVYENGLMKDEGGALDWTRNHTTNQIIFNSNRPVGSRIRVRIWA